MSDPDASPVDMEILPWSSTRGRPHPQGGRARLSGPTADPAHDRAPDPDPAQDPELRDGWQVLKAAALAPPTSAELAGLDAALEQFHAAVSLSTAEAREQGRRRMTTSTLGTRLGVAAAGAVVLGFGGLSAAALTGSLPGPAQDAVRPVAAAPAGADAYADQADADQAQPVSTPTADTTKDKGAKPTGAPTTAVGPDAKGPAAFGLCNAFAHAKDAGKAADRSVAFRNLVTAAGGEDKVEAYCATVEHPSARAKGKPADHPKGKPTDQPTDQPKGKPSSHPTGKPSTTPGSSPQAPPAGEPAAPGKPSTQGKGGKTG